MGLLLRRIAAAGLAVAVLCGCTASPKTTFAGEDGEQVTVDWQDYPGHAWIEADHALAAPSPDEAERIGTDVLNDVESALGAHYEFTWSTRTDATWAPRSGNGYGGSSSYVTYNSASRETDDLPMDPRDWSGIVEVVSAVSQEHGLGPVVLEHERFRRDGNDEALRSLQEEAGSADPDRFWHWSGVATSGSEWLMVDITDAYRHPDDAKVEEFQDIGVPLRSISLTYGVTTIADGERDTFRARLAPFDGLDKPEATASD